MKKVLSFVAAAIMVGIATAPVQAADSKSSGGSGEVGQMAKSTAWFPVQMLGVGAGWAVGTPIAITRQTVNNIGHLTGGAADKIGSKSNPIPNVFAMVYAVPVGTMMGVAQGVYLGGKNAIGHGTEHPFGLDSFSLGDDIEQ